MLTKYLVKREARKILRGIETLDTSKEIINDLARWRRAAASLIKEVYSEGSDLYRDLQSIRIEYPIELDDSREPVLYADPLQLGMDLKVRVEWVVKDLLQSVEKSGLPFGYRAPKRNMILSILATALISILATLVGVYATHWLNQSGQSQGRFGGRENESYKVTQVDMDYWNRNLSRQYQNGLDSVAEDVRRTESKGFVHSMTLKKWLEYAEKFERQIDKTQDSFLMEYAIQGGDTLTLEYKRKPLGNLSQKLRNSRAYKR